MLSGFTMSVGSVSCLSEKYSISRNLRQNFLMSAFTSVRLISGIEVNFNPYFVKTCFTSLFIVVEERFNSFALTVSVIPGCREVGLSAKKNHLKFLGFAVGSCPL